MELTQEQQRFQEIKDQEKKAAIRQAAVQKQQDNIVDEGFKIATTLNSKGLPALSTNQLIAIARTRVVRGWNK